MKQKPIGKAWDGFRSRTLRSIPDEEILKFRATFHAGAFTMMNLLDPDKFEAAKVQGLLDEMRELGQELEQALTEAVAQEKIAQK